MKNKPKDKRENAKSEMEVISHTETEMTVMLGAADGDMTFERNKDDMSFRKFNGEVVTRKSISSSIEQATENNW